MLDYIQQYQQAIDDGQIVVGRKIKQALKREKKDRKRSKKADFPYYFNNEYAQKAIEFIQLLPSAEGQPLKLELFQKYLISELFGWRKKKDDCRRFSQCFISFSRKNGKSFLLSCIASLYLLIENKPPENREILFLANTFKQAKISFNMFKSGLRHLAKESPAVRQRLKINDAEVWDKQSNSHAIAMASTLQNIDGYRSDLAVIDEYATAKDGNIKDIVKSGQINSDNALLAIISTSSNDLSSPMYEEYKFVSKILKGEKQADDYFVAIYEQDFKNETMKALKDPKLLEKSNPLLSNDQRRSVMLSKILDSIKLAIEQDNLLPVQVKNLNMWLQARKNSYISAKDWEKAIIKPPDIDGKPVWFGVDLSKSYDLTSVSWLIPEEDQNGQKYLYCDSHSWVGTKYGLKEKIALDKFDYIKGEKAGECSITKLDSGVIDHDDMLNFMFEFVQKHNLKVQAVCFDPYFSEVITKFCEQVGWQMVQIDQWRKTLSEPTIQFRNDLYNGKIKHPDNKLLEYFINNAILSYSGGGYPMIDKAKKQEKIDGLAALADGYVQARHYLTDGTGAIKHDSSYYESPDFSF